MTLTLNEQLEYDLTQMEVAHAHLANSIMKDRRASEDLRNDLKAIVESINSIRNKLEEK